MVGNGATNWNYDAEPVYAETFAAFNVISEDLLQRYKEKNCKFFWNDIKDNSKNPPECEEIWEKVLVPLYELNVYDLFRKVYPDNALKMKSPEHRLKSVNVNGKDKTYKRGFTMAEYTPWVKALKH